MRPLEAYESLMAFAAERGEEALHLALHASVPQSFRPDFLHLLRLNFLPDLSPAAEADVLLAPFCEDTGGGYYQFDPEVRRLLLSHLDPTFPEQKGERLHRVANLLVSYIGRQGRSLSAEQDRLSEEYLSIQAWVALAFLDPQQAAMQLAAALEQGLGERETAARVHFSGLSAALSVPLVQYPKLLTYAAGLEALEQGRTEDAADLLERMPDEEIRIGGVTLRSPHQILRNEETRSTQSSPFLWLKGDAAWNRLAQAGFRYHCYITGADPNDGKPFSFTEMLVDELTSALGAHFTSPQVFFDKSLQPQVEYSASLHDALCRSAVMVAICSPRYLEPKGRSGREWAAMEKLQRDRIPDESVRSIVPVILRRSKALPRAVQEAHPLDLSKIDLGHKSQLPAIARSAAGEIAETIVKAVEALSLHGTKAELQEFSLSSRSAFAGKPEETKPGTAYVSWDGGDKDRRVADVLIALRKVGFQTIRRDTDVTEEDRHVLEGKISSCSVFVAILSRNYLSNQWAQWELECARRVEGLAILPFLADDTPFRRFGPYLYSLLAKSSRYRDHRSIDRLKKDALLLAHKRGEPDEGPTEPT